MTVRLLEAWQEWDEKPGNEERAIRMEEACADLAGTLGTTTTKLRVALAAGRHRGWSRHRTIAELQTLPSQSQP